MTIDEFLVFEKENQCEELHIHNFHYWWYIRNELIMQYVYLRPSEEEHANVESQNCRKSSKVLRLFRFVLAAVQYSPFLKGKKNSLFILQDPVVFNPEGGFYECPPTQSVVKNWNGKKTLISDYYTHYFKNTFPVQFPETTFSVYPILRRKGKSLLWHLFGYEKKIKGVIAESISPILNKFATQYNCNMDLDNYITWTYHQYLYWAAYYKYYERLISFLKPYGVVEQCYYSTNKMVFNEVAKKCHVPTIELQHGFMGKDHRAYNSYIIGDKAFPDYVLTFSDYWKEWTRIPLPDERIISVGYPYLEERILKSKKEKRELRKKFKGRILLVIGSSDKVDEDLRKYLREVCKYVKEKKISDFKILYKMHPGFMDSYDLLCNMYSEYKDVLHVVRKDEKNLYDCFAIADEQLSIASTGIYEGLAYGLKTYIYQVQDPGSCINDLCARGLAHFVNRPEQLFESDQIDARESTKGMWMDHSTERLIDTLKQILRKEGNYESWENT